MKRSIVFLVLGISLLFFMSFIFYSEYVVTKKTAEVRQIEGLYIFFCGEPVSEYNYLGTVKLKIVGDNTNSRIYAIIKKAKKEYPHCEAVVFRELDLSNADCIKFK